jgi:hypothetical protein
MYFSKNNTFSNNQAVTASVASADNIDFGKTGTPYGGGGPLKRNFGKGNNIPKMAVVVPENFNNLTSLTVSVQTDDVNTFAAPVTLFTSPAYTLAQINDDKTVILPDYLPAGDMKRYCRLFYTVVGTAPTTGRITAGIVGSQQRDY